MTGTFPVLKQFGGHNTVTDLAIGIPAAIGAAVVGPEIFAALPGIGAAGATDLAAGVPAAAFGDPTAAALAGAGTDVGAAGVPAAAGLAGAAPGAPGVGAGTVGFGGGAGSLAGLTPADVTYLDPNLLGEAAIGPDVVPPPPPDAGVPFAGPGGLTQTGAGGLPTLQGGTAGVDPFAPSTMIATGADVVPGTAPPAMGGAFGTSPTPYLPASTLGGGPSVLGSLPAGTPAAAAPSMFGGLGNWISANPGTAALLGLGGASLGAQLLNKSSGVPYLQSQQNLIGQEQAVAQQQQAYGTALQQPLLTGQLPPGQQEAVAKGLQDAISTIKGRYAALDLTGSSMEADAIANAQNQAVIASTQIEQQMAQTGQGAIQSATQALNLEAGVYNTIMNAVLQQDQNLANAVSGFANAAALGTAFGAARTTP
jgi:hypothetical protein